MSNDPEILYWRRTDLWGLERLTLSVLADAVLAETTVICAEAGGFRLDHRWRLRHFPCRCVTLATDRAARRR